MRVYRPSYIEKKERTVQKRGFSRRRFLKQISFAVAIYFIPLSACKRLLRDNESRPGDTALSSHEKEVLEATQLHMLPEGGTGPGASEINALGFYEFVLSDRHLPVRDRKILINGIRWVEETAEELFQTGFIALSSEEKEAVLRDLETYSNGERWLSKVMNYILEALLGAPAYNINPGGIGWRWLDHNPGIPQPGKENIYGTFGYGI